MTSSIQFLAVAAGLLSQSGYAVARSLQVPAGHEWMAPGPTDFRSPCPGLNVLANHGYLPRNGQNITKAMFKKNIMQVYNLDDGLAELFADSGIKVLGPELPSISLTDLRKHDSIEHDASLTREDARTGDNFSVQPRLLQALLADAPQDYLDVETLAKSRNRRSRESQDGGSPALSVKATTLAYGETALILQALGKLSGGDELRPPKTAVQQWIGQERFPDNWQTPDPMTVGSTLGLSSRVQIAANAQEPSGLIGGLVSNVADSLVNKRGVEGPASGMIKRGTHIGHGIYVP